MIVICFEIDERLMKSGRVGRCLNCGVELRDIGVGIV